MDKGNDPIFILYKDGYEDAEFGNIVNRGQDYDGGVFIFYKQQLEKHLNGEEKSYARGYFNRNFWNGETIRLKRYDESLGDFSKKSAIRKNVIWILENDNFECPWKGIPYSMLALAQASSLSKVEMEYWIEVGAIEKEYLGMDPLEFSIRKLLGKKFLYYL